MIAALAMLATRISRTLSKIADDAQKLKVFVEHLDASRPCR